MTERCAWVILDIMVEEVQVQCPQCGETLSIPVDTSEGNYSTIEDCQVCCRPMNIEIICQPGRVEEVIVSVA